MPAESVQVGRQGFSFAQYPLCRGELLDQVAAAHRRTNGTPVSTIWTEVPIAWSGPAQRSETATCSKWSIASCIPPSMPELM
jgi:hypothetical protein